MQSIAVLGVTSRARRFTAENSVGTKVVLQSSVALSDSYRVSRSGPAAMHAREVPERAVLQEEQDEVEHVEAAESWND
jgi:hypothetical protein